MRQGINPNFVMGLLLAGDSKAYCYRDFASLGVVNEQLAGAQIVVWASDTGLDAYIRQVGDQVWILEPRGQITDLETGSTWDLSRGLAVNGSLAGEGLQGVPGSSSFDWAWLDFFPDSEFFAP